MKSDSFDVGNIYHVILSIHSLIACVSKHVSNNFRISFIFPLYITLRIIWGVPTQWSINELGGHVHVSQHDKLPSRNSIRRAKKEPSLNQIGQYILINKKDKKSSVNTLCYLILRKIAKNKVKSTVYFG